VTKLHSTNIQLGEFDARYLTGGQGEPVIFIHGGGSGSKSWLQIAKNLSKYHTVYVPDLPGFGATSLKDAQFTLLDYVSFIEYFSNYLGLDRFSLIGHSIGGYMAAQYALKYPDKVSKLVLVNSLGLGKEIALWVRVLSSAIFRKGLGQPLLAILKAVWNLARLLHSPFNYAIPISQIKVDIGKYITNLEGQTIVLLNSLSQLLMPTLIVWGARDTIVPVKQAYVAAQAIANCELRIFEECGHSVHSQKPGEFSELLGRFLS
jgi:4,5:9,10-diseco-3-hydroxy-5,9,17-trioxoandrosta-1(10),2-diene-4-oate hydrolase